MHADKISSQISFRFQDFRLPAKYHISNLESSGKKSFWRDEFTKDIILYSFKKLLTLKFLPIFFYSYLVKNTSYLPGFLDDSKQNEIMILKTVKDKSWRLQGVMI